MKPESKSKLLQSKLKAKARMAEFNVENTHIDMQGSNSENLFPLIIGILGDEAARISKLDIALPFKELRRALVTSQDLHFVAVFFKAYFSAKENVELEAELLLLGAAAYYLSDFSGSATVLAKQVQDDKVNADGWLKLLQWLLIEENWKRYPTFSEGEYSDLFNVITKFFAFYFFNGTLQDALLKSCHDLKKIIYAKGTPEDLLFCDVVFAVIIKHIINSARMALPIYSKLPLEIWQSIFSKRNFIKELWPAQHLLGEQGVLQGKSAVVQMPTSAGKTKAIELVIRSSFLADRSRCAVVVAPFRALCTEITNSLKTTFNSEEIIINELSDALQMDYEKLFDDSPDDGLKVDLSKIVKQQVLVVTPEKLLYALRHSPKLVSIIRLVIYDEGHQFDSGIRGVTYELLLTSIKRLLPANTQILLISAVIQNAEKIGEWLIGEEREIIKGENLATTEQAIAFSSWQYSLGQLQFVERNNSESFDYFAPRIIEQCVLVTKGREKPRYFPEKNDPNSIALYIGLKLVGNGGVAIFCGLKKTSLKMSKELVEAYERGLTLRKPAEFSNEQELSALVKLYEEHFGSEAIATKCARLGIFSHHGNAPHGIRLAIEYAMQQSLIKYMLCTSTLAQGVNLPIRYLIISTTHQGGTDIKTRDFHNLLGRAGRAGMYTEGTILFSNPSLFDQKLTLEGQWKWKKILNLLASENREPITSSLLDILNLTENDKERSKFLYVLQSYLMTSRGDQATENFYKEVKTLAKKSLAYHLANEEQKTALILLFLDVAKYIDNIEPEPTKQIKYGRTLLGIDSVIRIKNWLQENQNSLNKINNTEELLVALWPILARECECLSSYSPDQVMCNLALGWISEISFKELFEAWKIQGGKKNSKKSHATTLDAIVGICEHDFGYEITLIIAAVTEFSEELEVENKDRLISMLRLLQKKIKYGVSDEWGVFLFELGFADRMIIADLKKMLDGSNIQSVETIVSNEQIKQAIEGYPTYYKNIYLNLKK